MSASTTSRSRKTGRAALAPLLLPASLALLLGAGCGDPTDKGPGPRPVGSIAPAAPRAESAGSDPVPQRHRGKLPLPIDTEPGSGDDEEGGMAPPLHKPPPGGSTL